MPSQAIQVFGLGKKYSLISRRAKFVTLRDAVVGVASGIRRRLLHPFAKSVRESGREAFWALKDVSFAVKPGERFGIIGRNGAGKSTLLKILSRITEPTKGQAIINGRVASLLEVGTGFHPDLTGRENVFFNGAILGMTRQEIRQRFDQIVSFAGVEQFLDMPVKRYSSGMVVRLAFSVAAHLTPEILIVDEVLAVGDAEFQKKCLGIMRTASTAEGRTVLFVSHSMAAIQSLCDRALLLTRGEVTRIGPAEEIVDLYIGQGGSGDIANAKVVGDDFELCKVTARTPEQTPLATFKPAIIDVRFRALRDVIDAAVHIMFEDLNGASILGLDSRDFVQKVHARSGQEIICIFRLDSLPLTPGPFRLRLWLRSDDDRIEWEVPTSYDLHVEETRIYGTRRLERNWHGATAAVVKVAVDVA